VNIWIVQNSALDYDIHRPNLGPVAEVGRACRGHDPLSPNFFLLFFHYFLFNFLKLYKFLNFFK